MMIAKKLVEKIYARGLKATVDGGRIVLRGDEERITPKLVGLVRKHKPDLLQLLDPPRRDPRSIDRQRTRRQVATRRGNGSAERDLTVKLGKEQLPFLIWDDQELAGRIIGIDTETHPIVEHQIPRLVVASVSDGEQHFVVERDRLAEFLEIHADRHFVAHNMGFDFWVIQLWLEDSADQWWQIADRGKLHCTDLMEQLLRLAKCDEQPRNRGLDALALQYLEVRLFGKNDPRRMQFDTIDGQSLADVDQWFLQYAVQDAIAAIKIYSAQRELAKKLQPQADQLLPQASRRFGLLSETLQVRVSIVLAEITRTGVHLDPERLETARQELHAQLFQTAAELEETAPSDRPFLRRYKQERYITEENQGYQLNGSGYPKQIVSNVRDVFAEIAAEHDLDPPVTSSGKVTVSKDFWDDHRGLSPVVDLFLELNAKGKTYSFFRKLQGDHTYPKYNVIKRSGRVSCEEPNIQQMPREGNVREMFIPSPGHVLLAIDFSALELRTLAAVCLKKYKWSRLAEVINSGIDPHTYSYCQINGKSLEAFADWKEDDSVAAKTARDKIKGIVFGVPGSMHPPGLVQYTKKAYGQVISEEEATRAREKLINEVYPEWKRYLAQTGTRVHTLTGRRRGRIERPGQLFNTQFQGLASDGAKLCLWRLMRAGYRVVGFVHDEFLIELSISDDYSRDAADIEQICCETMQKFTPGVQIACEYTVSTVWSKKAEQIWKKGKLRAWSPTED